MKAAGRSLLLLAALALWTAAVSSSDLGDDYRKDCHHECTHNNDCGPRDECVKMPRCDEGECKPRKGDDYGKDCHHECKRDEHCRPFEECVKMPWCDEGECKRRKDHH